MLDLGLTKMALIGVVALVVLGPKRLPGVARTTGALFGRAQRYIDDIKAEVAREIDLDGLKRTRAGFETAALDVENKVHDVLRQQESELNDAWNPGTSMSDNAAGAGDADDVQVGRRQIEGGVEGGEVARDVRIPERVDDGDGLAATGQLARDVVRPADLSRSVAARVRGGALAPEHTRLVRPVGFHVERLAVEVCRCHPGGGRDRYRAGGDASQRYSRQGRHRGHAEDGRQITNRFT